ncbi:hypothetical protein HYY72_05870 [Candidatus Woesearchaeota archaeon]|nr:hypothetical protein [Candidatus Woesearchaeota archaeon]
MEHKIYDHSSDFAECDICGCNVSRLDFDSPLYCDKCIEEMERLEMSPKKYMKYLELRGSLGDKIDVK